MSQGFDLLGDPIPEGWGKRGRPPHTPTEEKRKLVKQLLAFGRTIEWIASALSITPPTLRKNYFRELRQREEARAGVEGKLLASLMAEVEKGNVSAIKEYWHRLEKHDQAVLAAKVANRGATDTKTETLGKKQMANEAARQIGGMYAPPPAPGMTH